MVMDESLRCNLSQATISRDFFEYLRIEGVEIEDQKFPVLYKNKEFSIDDNGVLVIRGDSEVGIKCAITESLKKCSFSTRYRVIKNKHENSFDEFSEALEYALEG